MCKECGGASFCEHGRRRSCCKECGGSSFCEHGRQHFRCKECKECGGSGIRKHRRRRHQCKERSQESVTRHASTPQTVQAPTEGVMDGEGWDMLSEDREFRDALAAELFVGVDWTSELQAW